MKADEGAYEVTKVMNNPKSKCKKRARSATPVQTGIAYEDAPAAKKPKEGNKAKSRSLHIPLDETCTLSGPAYRVYIDEDDTIYDAALNQTDSGNNANRFYRIQLLTSSSGNYQTWTRWGRVGEHGAHAHWVTVFWVVHSASLTQNSRTSLG